MKPRASAEGLAAADQLIRDLGWASNGNPGVRNAVGVAFDLFAKSCRRPVGRPLGIQSGDRFGYLTVVSRSRYTPMGFTASPNAVLWNVMCDCGTEKIVRANNLTSGNTKSCGCMQKRHASIYHELQRIMEPAD